MKRFFGILALLVLLNGGLIAYAFDAPPAGFETSPPPAGLETSPPPAGLSPALQEADGQNYRRLFFWQLAEGSTGHLMLVDNDFAVPDEIPAYLVNVIDYVRTLNRAQLMDQEALVMLREMFNSAARAGFAQFRVTEGFRSFERQAYLYNSEEWGPFSAAPGHSEHQLGLAADISYPGVNIGNSRQGTWLMENSFRYGFVLSFPSHKTEITGFPFEPWHYRFVGQPHAYFMRTNDLVLVEYINFLRENGEIAVTVNDTAFRVFYLAGTDEYIKIPTGYYFSASLDNTGGIIITAWR